MSILLLAEHDGKTLHPATRACVSAAQAIGGELHVLVVGAAEIAAQAAKINGVTKVFSAQGTALAENIAPLLVQLAPNYSHVLAAASTTGKDILPRAAALLDVQQISDVTAIVSHDTFVHPIYAGNALETVQSADKIKLLTIRTTAFAQSPDGGNAPIETLPALAADARVSIASQEQVKGDRPDLSAARVVVSGGRGVGSKEGFEILARIADKLGAALGASRAAVDAGYCPNDWQVGQTGKVVAPELYIAIGISGAIQHIAGMKDSKIIVAINKDENAPIFEVADYGLVADLFAALPELEQALG